MKKKIGASILCVLVLCMAYGVEWELIRDSNAYDGYYQYIKEFKKNQIVKARDTFIDTKDQEMKYDYAVEIKHENDSKLLIDAEAVKPKGTKHLLDDDLLTPALSRKGKSYFNSYAVDILKSKNRETARQFEPKGIAYFEADGSTWWKSFYDDYLKLFQTLIVPSGLSVYSSFYITNIVKNANSYTLDVINDQWGLRDTVIPADIQPEMNGQDTGYKATLTLYPDGDYLDIFYNEKYLLGSYIAVETEFIKQFESLLETNYCDLTNVTFPRRADKNHSVGTSCIVAENLRLRKEESTSSATLHTMKAGTKVTILQLGKQQTIDGITANWVQVQLADGQNTRGWCFGGYLLEH